MSSESPIRAALNRLSTHFGACLLIYPPATADALAELAHFAGPLPREFMSFLSISNGLRIHADGPDTELHLWGATEILACALGGDGLGLPPGLFCVRGDPTGERDWLVGGDGPTRGVLIRWDPWIPGAQLIASSFGAYLAAWAGWVTSRYGREGERVARPRQALFDRAFLRSVDPMLAMLSCDVRIKEWLGQLDHAVACGDDFE